MTNTSETKLKKAKGPIRTGALVPSLILLGLIYSYFFLFFDGHLRRGIEFVATRVHGAEVNVGSLRTSFLRASLSLRGLEVTDKEMPERNLVQIGEIRFQALWDALLRGKVAIEEASVLDIQAHTQRRSPGYVIPPPPPSAPGEGLLARAQNQVLEQTRQRFNQNFLGDVAEVASGTDPKAKLQELQGNLKAEARAKELEQELEKKKAEWQKRIAELPKPQDIREIEGKIKALNLNTKNPVELAGNLKKAKDLVSEAQAKVKQVEQTQGQLTGDIQAYTKAVSDLERIAREDAADLQKRLQIPGIDPKEFSTQLFMGEVEKRIVGLRKYVALARQYMPPKKSAEEKAKARAQDLVPPARGEGRTYQFPITKGYPLFWLKKASVSSEIAQSEWAGKVAGEITDLTTSPSELGRPTKVRLTGDFPKQRLHGIDFLATIDHTGEKAKESIKAAVGSFPVAGRTLADSPGVKLGLREATGSATLQATLADEALQVALGSRFEKAQFDFDAKSAPVKEILGAVLKGIPTVTMNASVTGSWDRLSISVNSNLGSELSQGFQRQLQAKLGDAKEKLQKLVDEKIGPSKKKVQELLAGLSGGPAKALAQSKDDMSKSLASAQKSSTGGGAGASPADKGKNLLKGFGF